MSGAVVRDDVVYGEGPEVALVPAQQVSDVLAVAVAQAEQIAAVIDQKDLAVRIGGRPHVRVEAWTALAQANGKRFDVLELQREGDPASDTYTARACVGLRDMRTGEVSSRAWASCSRSERQWKQRDAFAIESMAQTRAAGKVARLVYGWVVALAGYEATPAEEIAAGLDDGPDSLTPDQAERYAQAWKAATDDQRKAVTEQLTAAGYKAGEFRRRGAAHYEQVMAALEGREAMP